MNSPLRPDSATRALLLSTLRPNSISTPLRYEGHLSVYSANSSPFSPLLNISEGEDGPPPYRCNKCDFIELSSLEVFRAHQRESHWNTNCSSSNNNSLEDDLEEDDFDEGPPTKSSSPSNGKIKSKSLKCKQCNYIGISKEDFWIHTRHHIKPEKILSCPKCPFVTEYKHHLEYHLRNHFGSKPFKCRACSYSCVNKSMLNSHMKSHNNIFQYRCADCSYATKYCHSLKLHLRKYKHKPDVVLNSDGSVNPLPVIDVYGTRRGPKTKKDDSGNPVIPPFALPQSATNTLPKQPSPVAAVSPYNAQVTEEDLEEEEDFETPREESPHSNNTPPYLEYLRTLLSNSNPLFLQEPLKSLFLQNMSLKQQQQQQTSPAKEMEPWSHVCIFCEVAFRDPIMHTIHMGYHGFSNPFKCNMCGEEARDKLGFFLHVARKSHV